MAPKIEPTTPPTFAFDINASTARPGEALETAIRAARLADPVITGPDGRQYAMVPKDFLHHELPDDARRAPFTRQRLTVDDRMSLIAYTNRFSDKASVILADYDMGTISTRLDWHPHNQITDAFGRPGRDEHSITLKLRPSEEYARWNAFANKMHSQADFALFLEENASDILHPDAATMIEISRDFEATVGQSYKSAARLDNGDRKLMFQSETNISSGVVIPQKFSLSIPLYNGEEPEELVANFRWRPAQGDGVTLGFQWHRVEYMRRARFTLIASDTAEATGLPYFIGRQGNPT